MTLNWHLDFNVRKALANFGDLYVVLENLIKRKHKKNCFVHVTLIMIKFARYSACRNIVRHKIKLQIM